MGRIAILVKTLTSGGAEKQATLLAKALSRDFDSHIIVLDGTAIDERYYKMLEGTGVIIHAIRGGKAASFRAVVSLFRKNRYNVVFSYLTAANAVAAIAGKITGTPVVTGIRSSWLPKVKLISERLVTRHLAAATVCNSFSGKDALVSQGLSQSKALTISNCFENIAEHSEKAPSQEVRVITVGRFVAPKDYETAISAVAMAAGKVNNLRFDIVGYGELEESIRKWLKEYGIEDITRVSINPPNIPELLSQADIYLSTSIFEGTSNSIMEALNADLPVVATRVGDNDRLVEDGVNGILCEVAARKEIAEAIVKLAQDETLRRDMGRESKKILIRDFSVDSFRDKYEQLISKITG